MTEVTVTHVYTNLYIIYTYITILFNHMSTYIYMYMTDVTVTHIHNVYMHLYTIYTHYVNNINIIWCTFIMCTCTWCSLFYTHINLYMHIDCCISTNSQLSDTVIIGMGKYYDSLSFLWNVWCLKVTNE